MAQTILNNQILDNGNAIASTMLPDTQVVTPPIATSSRPAQIEGAKNGSKLMQMLAKYNIQGNQTGADDKIDVGSYSDAYTQMLDRVAQTSGNATKALINSIKAKKMQNEGATQSNYESYKKGLQLLGIQHNQAQFTPDLLAGQITQVEAEKQQKLQQLDAEEAKALMDAEDAQAKNDLTTLKAKMDYVDKIKEEKKNAIKDLYEKMYYEQKVADIQAGQIYDELQKLGGNDREAFLVEMSKQLGVPVGSLIKSISDIQAERIKAAKSGSGGGYTPVELRKLRQAGIDPTDTTAADDYLYGDNAGGELNKTDFSSKLAQVISTKPTFGDGTPYFYNDEITAEGFKQLSKAAGKYGVSRVDLIKELKPYLNSKNKALKAYGITNAEADEAKL